MEAKKVQQSITSQKADEAVKTGAGIVEFTGEVKAELTRINWTSPEELRTYTKIVVVATLALGIGIYCVDLIIQGFLNGLGLLFRFIS